MEGEYMRRPVPAPIAHLVTARPRSARQQFRTAVHSVAAALAAAALALCVLSSLGEMPWDRTYRTDWFLLAVLVGMGPAAFFYLSDFRRIRAIDDRFPDFLRDLAESARGGMTLPRALQSAAQGRYGALTPEIQRMSHQVEWGVTFGEALDRFADRTASPLIHRTVNLIQEARRSGGNVVDILTAAAEDARELKQIQETRQGQMAAYTVVIYVTFIVFLVVVAGLQAQMVPKFAQVVEEARAEGKNLSFGPISIQPPDKTFGELFFHAAIVQSFTGGLVAGQLRRSNPLAGIWAVLVMVGVAWVTFRLLIPLMGG